MYSILIKVGSKNYEFDADDEGVVFTGNAEETKARYAELLEQYVSSKLVIVHNTTLTNELTIADVD